MLSVPSTTVVNDTFGFNAADQMTSISDDNGANLFSARYGRDGNGQLSSDSSVPSAVGSYRYTALNQLCYGGSANSAACSAPPSGSQAYGFDAADNLTSNNGTTQQFNSATQLCWTVTGPSANPCGSAPAGATTYGYDTRGNRTSAVLPSGSALCEAWDEANRLTGISAGTGSSCGSPTTVGTYTYDGLGQRATRTVGGTTTQFAWDGSAGVALLLQETAGGVSTSYLYGPGGLPVEQIASSRPAITMVGSPVTAADSTGTGGPLSLTLPASTAAGDQIILATTYPAGAGNSANAPSGYVAVGLPVNSGGTSATADVTQVWRRTATASEPPAALTYSGTFPKTALAVVYRGVDPTTPIDVSGTGTQAGGTTVSASATTRFANEQLLVLQGATYAATAAASWTAPGGTGEGSQQDATTVHIGLADGAQANAGATGTLTSTLGTTGVFLGQPQLTTVLIALQTRPLVAYYHHDHLGSTRLLTDTAGGARGSYTFDPYGNLTSSTALSVSLLFAAQYRDGESGLYYLRARYYDPSTGQFISRDPAVATTREAYAYVGDNPLNATDPAGLLQETSGACTIFSPCGEFIWDPNMGIPTAEGLDDLSTKASFAELGSFGIPVAGEALAPMFGTVSDAAALGSTGLTCFAALDDNCKRSAGVTTITLATAGVGKAGMKCAGVSGIDAKIGEAGMNIISNIFGALLKKATEQ